jgi:Lrp/AsnC family transcriptional regulator, regulator for asnA, asnC and gidA
MRLDKLDRELIAALKEDGRMSFKDLGDRLAVAEGTVRNRLNRLLESNIIHIGPIVDQTKIGYRLNVWIGVRCRPGTFRGVAQEFAKLHAVRYVGAATGAYDVICEAIFLSQAEMLAFLEEELPKIDGVTETQTSVVLEITKLGYEWELREEDVRRSPILREGEIR